MSYEPLTPAEMPREGERWVLSDVIGASGAGLKRAAQGTITVDAVGATDVYARTDDGFTGRLEIRALLKFWRREVSDAG